MTTIIKITAFDPLKLELPTTPIVTGAIHLALPQLHVKVLDFSMGGIIPDGPYLGGDVEALGLDFDLGDSEVTLGELVQFIHTVLPQLKEMWRIAQVEFDRRFLLGSYWHR